MRIVKKQEAVRKAIIDSCKLCSGNGCRNCANKVEHINKLASAGIPALYWNLSMQTFAGNEMLKKKIANYVNTIDDIYIAGKVLVFMGGMGTGKTFGGIEILKAATNKNYTILYTTFTEIIDMLLSKTENLIFKNLLLATDYVMIDELDTRYMSSSERAREIYGANLEYIIRTRMQNGLPMIFCTNNSDLDLFDGIFGEALGSLLSQKHVEITPVGGLDLRQGK
jgi:DNA replication protein DnaC